ncbi:hypothetical protein LCGC14_0653580 [marine sediment metagenome]|uniref:Uncharacterized protein n=1 Tax=marine sediment metagenome TaxID=412755 RepID=A0A0F9U3X1_9ZZZZ
MISPSPILYAINGNALCGCLIEKCNVRDRCGLTRWFSCKAHGREQRTLQRPDYLSMPVYNGRFSTKRLQRFAPQVGETHGAMSVYFGKVGR